MAKSRKTLLLACLLIPALAAGAVRTADAGYLASNLGPSDAFGSSSYNLTGPKASTGLGYELAVQFKVSGSSPIAFGSAELALSYHNGANAVDVLLSADQGGFPGSTLETIHLAGLSQNASLVVANSTAHSLLTPGTTYWLVALASNDTYMSWSVNSTSQSGHLAYRTDSGSGPGAWAIANGNLDAAFAINAFTPAVAVPAPSSVALLGMGALTLAGFRIRRRARESQRTNA